VRVLATLAALATLGGCSVLDQINLNGPARLDPNKVYLGTGRVNSLSARETGRYACVGPPMICVQRGIGFDCSCP
jgi:hypothetical protein